MDKVILLAEDSPDDALIFTRVLRRAGVTNPIIEVHSGTGAICYLKGEGPYADRQKYPFPAVLFLDIAMPDGDGREVLTWLQGNPVRNQVLVILLAGRVHLQGLSDAYLAGANTFLAKPFNPVDLDGLIFTWPDVWMLPPDDFRLGRHPGDSHKPGPRL